MTERNSLTKTRLDLDACSGSVLYPYITSESGQSAWGQPPISHYVFVALNDTLYGQLIAGSGTTPFPAMSAEVFLDPDLDLEFQAWESLSDEAFLDFEQDLD